MKEAETWIIYSSRMIIANRERPGLLAKWLACWPMNPRSIPLWAPIFQCVFSSFLAFNAELLHTSIMDYKNGKNVTPKRFILNNAQNLWGWGYILPS